MTDPRKPIHAADDIPVIQPMKVVEHCGVPVYHWLLYDYTRSDVPSCHNPLCEMTREAWQRALRTWSQ